MGGTSGGGEGGVTAHFFIKKIAAVEFRCV